MIESCVLYVFVCRDVPSVTYGTLRGASLVASLARQVRRALEADGAWDDTLVMYSSDNGGQPWHGARNYPLRGGKQSAYEGGCRSAAFVRFPPAFPSLQPRPRGGNSSSGSGGGGYPGLMHIADWMPTILGAVDAVAGAVPPTPDVRTSHEGGTAAVGEPRLEGYDHTPALLSPGVPPPRTDVLMQFDHSLGRQVGYRRCARAGTEWV